MLNVGYLGFFFRYLTMNRSVGQDPHPLLSLINLFNTCQDILGSLYHLYAAEQDRYCMKYQKKGVPQSQSKISGASEITCCCSYWSVKLMQYILVSNGIKCKAFKLLLAKNPIKQQRATARCVATLHLLVTSQISIYCSEWEQTVECLLCKERCMREGGNDFRHATRHHFNPVFN